MFFTPYIQDIKYTFQFLYFIRDVCTFIYILEHDLWSSTWRGITGWWRIPDRESSCQKHGIFF